MVPTVDLLDVEDFALAVPEIRPQQETGANNASGSPKGLPLHWSDDRAPRLVTLTGSQRLQLRAKRMVDVAVAALALLLIAATVLWLRKDPQDTP